MSVKSVGLVGAVLSALLLAACHGATVMGKADLPGTLDSVSTAQLMKLLNARLFFGHQSVGFNIIEGMKTVLSLNGGWSIAVTETRDAAVAVRPGVIHSTIGQNRDPLGKIRDFEAIMRSGMAKQVDIAFMKLCYVDVEPDTDLAAIFRAYRDAFTRLKADFPHTVFVHFTVPLVSQEKGIKPLVKKLLGRQVRGFKDNLAREKLNRLLRAEYAGKEPLFDLALLESTRPDGSQNLSMSPDGTYGALEASYTNDGGHLSPKGQAFIGGQLLTLLAGLVR